MRLSAPHIAGLCLLVSLVLFLPVAGAPLSVPRLQGYVNDYANILAPGDQASLETILKGLETRTTNQIVVLTVPSLEGDSLEEFSIRVAEEWKIGRKGKDNGAILLIAPQDRAVRIEVGYGLEGELTDAECDAIIQRRVLPRFREGNYYAGIADGLAGMMAILDPGGDHPPVPAQRSEKVGMSGLLFLMLFFLFFLSRVSQIFSPRRRLRSGWWGGGGFGGFGTGGFGGGGGGHFGGGGASGRW